MVGLRQLTLGSQLSRAPGMRFVRPLLSSRLTIATGPTACGRHSRAPGALDGGGWGGGLEGCATAVGPAEAAVVLQGGKASWQVTLAVAQHCGVQQHQPAWRHDSLFRRGGRWLATFRSLRLFIEHRYQSRACRQQALKVLTAAGDQLGRGRVHAGKPALSRRQPPSGLNTHELVSGGGGGARKQNWWRCSAPPACVLSP